MPQLLLQQVQVEESAWPGQPVLMDVATELQVVETKERQNVEPWLEAESPHLARWLPAHQTPR